MTTVADAIRVRIRSNTSPVKTDWSQRSHKHPAALTGTELINVLHVVAVGHCHEDMLFFVGLDASVRYGSGIPSFTTSPSRVCYRFDPLQHRSHTLSPRFAMLNDSDAIWFPRSGCRIKKFHQASNLAEKASRSSSPYPTPCMVIAIDLFSQSWLASMASAFFENSRIPP